MRNSLIGVLALLLGLAGLVYSAAAPAASFGFDPVEVEKFGVLWFCDPASLVSITPEEGNTEPGALAIEALPGLSGIELLVEEDVEWGHTYLVDAWVKPSLTAADALLGVRCYDAEGALVSEQYSRGIIGITGWSHQQALFVLPEEADSARVVLAVRGSEAASPSGLALFDDVVFTRSANLDASSSRKGNVFFAPRPIKSEITLVDLPDYVYNLKFEYEWHGLNGEILDKGEYPFVEYNETREVNFKFDPVKLGVYTLHWKASGSGIPDLEGIAGYSFVPRPDHRHYVQDVPVRLDADLAWLSDESDLSNACYVLRMAGVGYIRDSFDLGRLASEGDAYLTSQKALLETQRVAGLQVLKSLRGFPEGLSGQELRTKLEKLFGEAYKAAGNEVESWQLFGLVEADEAGLDGMSYASLAKVASSTFRPGVSTRPLLTSDLEHNRIELRQAALESGLDKSVTGYSLSYTGTPEDFPAWLAGWKAALPKTAKIWLTSAYTSMTPDETGSYEAAQWKYAADAVKLSSLALANGVAAVFHTAWAPPAGPGERWSCVVNPDYSPEPAYGTIAALLETLGKATYLGALPTVPGRLCASLRQRTRPGADYLGP